jgi:hypothetical protein
MKIPRLPTWKENSMPYVIAAQGFCMIMCGIVVYRSPPGSFGQLLNMMMIGANGAMLFFAGYWEWARRRRRQRDKILVEQQEMIEDMVKTMQAMHEFNVSLVPNDWPPRPPTLQ